MVREGGMVERYGENRKRRREGGKNGGREERNGMKKKNGRSWSIGVSRRSEGSTEEFIKNNIKNWRGERKQTKREAEREAESYTDRKKEKKNLFMIHHIDSPRQLEWWRQGNTGVCLICYSVLRCGAVACWLVVLWFFNCLGHVRINPHTTTTLPTPPPVVPNTPTLHPTPSISSISCCPFFCL